MTTRLLELAETALKKVLEKKEVTQSQVAAFQVNQALTRYANSQIHQNVAAERSGIAIKVAIEKKIGTLH